MSVWVSAPDEEPPGELVEDPVCVAEGLCLPVSVGAAVAEVDGVAVGV